MFSKIDAPVCINLPVFFLCGVGEIRSQGMQVCLGDTVLNAMVDLLGNHSTDVAWLVLPLWVNTSSLHSTLYSPLPGYADGYGVFFLSFCERCFVFQKPLLSSSQSSLPWPGLPALYK